MDIVCLGGRKNGKVYKQHFSTKPSIDTLYQHKGSDTENQVGQFQRAISYNPFTENFWLKLIKFNGQMKYFYIHEDLDDVEKIRDLVSQYWELGTIAGYDFD